jgi:hypothetical protein
MSTKDKSEGKQNDDNDDLYNQEVDENGNIVREENDEVIKSSVS